MGHSLFSFSVVSVSDFAFGMVCSIRHLALHSVMAFRKKVSECTDQRKSFFLPY